MTGVTASNEDAVEESEFEAEPGSTAEGEAGSQGQLATPHPKHTELGEGKRGKKEKKKKKKSVTINLQSCKYDLLRRVVEHLGWKEVGEGEESLLLWSDVTVGQEKLMRLSRAHKVNHFPGMQELARKRPLARNISRMQAAMPDVFNFFPHTLFIPEDTNELLNIFHASNKGKKRLTYIVKPDSGAKGKGIGLCQDASTARAAIVGLDNHPAVAQRYMSNPLLIGGYKFDLRLYVLVTSCDPLRAYLYREGLVRFATEPYAPPTLKNISQQRMHLTNYSINKFAAAEDDDDLGSFGGDSEHELTEAETKWTLASLREWMEASGYDFSSCWSEVSGIIAKALACVQPSLAHNYKAIFTSETGVSSCFELLGVDIMLDKKAKPWLMEVNHSPSFAVTSDEDAAVKEPLISETLKIVKPSFSVLRKVKEEDRAQAMTRLYNASTNTASSPSPSEAVEAAKERQETWEHSRLSGFELLLPSPDADKNSLYAAIMDQARMYQSQLVSDHSSRQIKRPGSASSSRPSGQGPSSSSTSTSQAGKKPSGPPKLSTASRFATKEARHLVISEEPSDFSHTDRDEMLMLAREATCEDKKQREESAQDETVERERQRRLLAALGEKRRFRPNFAWRSSSSPGTRVGPVSDARGRDVPLSIHRLIPARNAVPSSMHVN